MNKINSTIDKIIEMFDEKFFHKGNVLRVNSKGRRIYAPIKTNMFTPNRVKSFIKVEFNNAMEEERKEILQIVLEDVPHKYQNRLIKKLK